MPMTKWEIICAVVLFSLVIWQLHRELLSNISAELMALKETIVGQTQVDVAHREYQTDRIVVATEQLTDALERAARQQDASGEEVLKALRQVNDNVYRASL